MDKRKGGQEDRWLEKRTGEQKGRNDRCKGMIDERQMKENK